MVIYRPEKTNADLCQVLEVGIFYVARRAVILHQILVVLIIGSGEFRIGTQVLRGPGIGLQRTRPRAPGRIVPARTGLRLRGAGEQDNGYGKQNAAHGVTPWAAPAGTWRWLQSQPTDQDGTAWPGFRWTPEAG